MNGKQRKLIIFGIYLIILLFAVTKYTVDYINKVAIVSFKKLYSEYSQALQMTVYDMNGDIGCYYTSNKTYKSDFSNCESFYKKFATNLKVRKYCKNNALNDGCVPIYKTYATQPYCAGFSESMFNRFNQAFVMDDNSNIVVFNQPAKIQKPMFAVDSNGMLFPNKSGYDLFSFVVMRNKNGNYYFHSNVTYCLPKTNGGIQMLQDVYK